VGTGKTRLEYPPPPPPHLDRVEAAARGLRVRIAQRRARLLAQGAVLVVTLPGGAAVAVSSVLHAGVDGPGDGAAVRSAGLHEAKNKHRRDGGGKAGDPQGRKREGEGESRTRKRTQQSFDQLLNFLVVSCGFTCAPMLPAKKVAVTTPLPDAKKKRKAARVESRSGHSRPTYTPPGSYTSRRRRSWRVSRGRGRV